MSASPLISAIICTYNRAPLLRQALEALCEQTLPTERMEIVLVDDGSDDDTKAVVESFADRLPLRAIHQHNAGLFAARNRGIAAATAPIVVFLDDDIPDSACLEQHYLSHQRFPGQHIAVLGHTDLLAKVAHSPLMRFVTGSSGLLLDYATLVDGELLDFTHFRGGHSSCKRELLQHHGVFDPQFRAGAGDIELGYRLSSAGLKVRYNRHAVSHMARALSFDEFCRRSELDGRANRALTTLHPDPVITQITGIDDAVRQWPDLAPRYRQILTSGRRLDQFATLRTQAGLPMDGITTRLLHRAYSTAFRASRICGTATGDNRPLSA